MKQCAAATLHGPLLYYEVAQQGALLRTQDFPRMATKEEMPLKERKRENLSAQLPPRSHWSNLPQEGLISPIASSGRLAATADSIPGGVSVRLSLKGECPSKGGTPPQKGLSRGSQKAYMGSRQVLPWNPFRGNLLLVYLMPWEVSSDLPAMAQRARSQILAPKEPAAGGGGMGSLEVVGSKQKMATMGKKCDVFWENPVECGEVRKQCQMWRGWRVSRRWVVNKRRSVHGTGE